MSDKESIPEIISRNKRKKLLRVLRKLKFKPASITEGEALGEILNILDTDFLRGE